MEKCFRISLPRPNTCPMNFLHDLFKKKKYSLGDNIPGFSNKSFLPVRKQEASFIEAKLENWYPYLQHFKNWEQYLPQRWVVKIRE